MKPPVLDPNREPAWLDRARASVAAGDVVALPTETFYGLAVDPRDAVAVERLLRLKGYAPGRPVLLLAAGREQVDRAARVEETEGAAALADAFWPGPLTLVLPLRDALPACPGGTLAIRVPDAPWVRRLSAACGHPLTGTSANRAGAPPATTADAVGAQFPSGIGLVVDGGSSPGGAPSTLLDLTGPSPRLLREGRIGRRVLQERLGLALSGPPAERP